MKKKYRIKPLPDMQSKFELQQEAKKAAAIEAAQKDKERDKKVSKQGPPHCKLQGQEMRYREWLTKEKGSLASSVKYDTTLSMEMSTWPLGTQHVLAQQYVLSVCYLTLQKSVKGLETFLKWSEERLRLPLG